MLMLVIKYAVTAGVIVTVSEIAKRMDRLGALISSLPFITIMIMIWLHIETQNSEKIASHAYYTFWYVLPTLPMFLVMPWMMKKGIHFWLSLGASSLLTIALFFLTAYVMKRFGVFLMP